MCSVRNADERIFRLDEETFSLLEAFKLPAKVVRQSQRFPQGQELSEAEFLGLLEEHLPDLGPRQRDRVLDAAAVAAYHAQLEFPIVRLSICDDAPQFELVTEELALCWVHDGRHYEKLTPCIAYHRQLLDTFLERYWDFYDQLLAYREHPTPEERARLEKESDELFSTVTGYEALDGRIAKTKAKKRFLLMVLEHPEIPGSLGVCMVNVSESRTCSGSLRVTPNKLGSPIPRPCEIPKSQHYLRPHLDNRIIGIDGG